jgi:hypothetical protein
MIFSNPRTEATIENWPSGSRRVTANFKVETNNKGSRVVRTTTGAPKLTTYYLKMVLVDGDDGKIYAIGNTIYNQAIAYPGTMKFPVYYYEGTPEHAQIFELLGHLKVAA